MTTDIPDELARKLRNLLVLVDQGVVAPDPVELAAAAYLLREHGELELARRYERLARRVLPNLRRDLS